MLLVRGYGGEVCTTTVLPDKEDKDYHQQHRHYYTTNTSSYRINIISLML